MFIFIGQILYGQTDKDKALEKGRTAIELMDNGKIDESIELLKEAQKLDPDRFDYPYELAYALDPPITEEVICNPRASF